MFSFKLIGARRLQMRRHKLLFAIVGAWENYSLISVATFHTVLFGPQRKKAQIRWL